MELFVQSVYGHDDEIRLDLVDGLEDFLDRIAQCHVDTVGGTADELLTAKFFQALLRSLESKLMESTHMLGIRFSPIVAIVGQVLGNVEQMYLGPVFLH